MKHQEEIQKKYLEMQTLEQQVKQLQQQNEIFNQHLLETLKINTALDELKEVKIGAESFIPLGPGIFVKGEIKETSKVLVTAGANVAVIKSTKEAKEMVEAQITEIQTLIARTEQELEKTVNDAQSLHQEMQRLMQEK